MVYEKCSGHIGGSFSLAEIIAYLYSNFDLTSDKNYSPKLYLNVIPARIVVIGKAVEIANFENK